MRFLMPYFIVVCLALALKATTVQADDIHRIAEDKNKAVFFIYHHIGEDQYPNSNLQTEKFATHIQELKNDEYKVLAVPDIINKLKSGLPIPHHTIGITLDGAYRSTFDNAIPLLLKAKLPFTLFIAPERIDRNSDYYMNWKEIKKLAKNNLVSIGALPFSYQHIINIPENEQFQQWNRSISRFREMLNYSPKIFAWPYGEYTTEIKETMKTYGFQAGFAQNSGVAFLGSDIMSLPRFSMTDEYGDLDRFRLAAHSFPFPTTNDMPIEMTLNSNKPEISFTLPESLSKRKKPSCFISNIGKVSLNIQSDAKINIVLNEALSEKRVRMNCTIPILTVDEEKQSEQHWRWYGRLFIMPKETD